MSTKRHTSNTAASAFEKTKRTGATIYASPGTAASAVMPSASTTSKPRGEEGVVIACRSEASATIREGIDGRQQFLVSGALLDLGASWIGTFRAVYRAKVFSQSDLVDYPEPPEGPFDRPYRYGEPEWSPSLNPAKSEWTFEKIGLVAIGVGQGLARIASQPGGGIAFWYATNSFLYMLDSESYVALGEVVSMATASFPEVPSLVEGKTFPLHAFHYLSLSPFDDRGGPGRSAGQ